MTILGSFVHSALRDYGRSRLRNKVTVEHRIGVPPPVRLAAEWFLVVSQLNGPNLRSFTLWPLVDLDLFFGSCPVHTSIFNDLGYYIWHIETVPPPRLVSAQLQIDFTYPSGQRTGWHSDVDVFRQFVADRDLQADQVRIHHAHFDLASPRSVVGNPLRSTILPFEPVCQGGGLDYTTSDIRWNYTTGSDGTPNPASIEQILSSIRPFLSSFSTFPIPPTTPGNPDNAIRLSVYTNFAGFDLSSFSREAATVANDAIVQAANEAVRAHQGWDEDQELSRVFGPNIAPASFQPIEWIRALSYLITRPL